MVKASRPGAMNSRPSPLPIAESDQVERTWSKTITSGRSGLFGAAGQRHERIRHEGVVSLQEQHVVAADLLGSGHPRGTGRQPTWQAHGPHPLVPFGVLVDDGSSGVCRGVVDEDDLDLGVSSRPVQGALETLPEVALRIEGGDDDAEHGHEVTFPDEDGTNTGDVATNNEILNVMTAVANDADIAPHADAEPAAAARARRHRRLGAHRVDGRLGVLDRADIGEQDALEARADRAHRLVRVLRLLDLDHAAQSRDLEGTAEIVEIVHVERRVLGGELDIVVLAGMADQLHQGRPAGEDVRAHGRLAGVETFAEQIAAHGHDDSPEDAVRLLSHFEYGGGQCFRRRTRLTICFAHAAYQMQARFEARKTGIRNFQVWNYDDFQKRVGEADVVVVSGMWKNELIPPRRS